jgi:hypothetical protein
MELRFKISILLVLLSTFTTSAQATIPHVFTAGDQARANDVNQNFDYLLKISDTLLLNIDSLEVQRESDTNLVAILEGQINVLEDNKELLDNEVLTIKANLVTLTSQLQSTNDELLISNNLSDSIQNTAVLALTGVSEANNSIDLLSNASNELLQVTSTNTEAITILSDDLTQLNNTFESTINNVESNESILTNLSLTLEEHVLEAENNNISLNENTQEVSELKLSLATLELEVFDITVGDICEGDRLGVVGSDVVSFVHTPTGVTAGESVQLNGDNIAVYTLPYWNDQSDHTATITLPLGKLSVYTTRLENSPCNNAEINDYPALITLVTKVDYEYNLTDIDAVITSTVNVKIKVDFTVFDLSYSVSSTVSLGGVGITHLYDIKSDIEMFKSDHNSELLNLLNNVSIGS